MDSQQQYQAETPMLSDTRLCPPHPHTLQLRSRTIPPRFLKQPPDVWGLMSVPDLLPFSRNPSGQKRIPQKEKKARSLPANPTGLGSLCTETRLLSALPASQSCDLSLPGLLPIGGYDTLATAG